MRRGLDVAGVLALFARLSANNWTLSVVDGRCIRLQPGEMQRTNKEVIIV